MKHFSRRNFLKLAVAFALVCVMAVQPVATYAEEANSNTDERIMAAETAVTEMAEDSITAVPTAVEPRAHVSYYPSSGVSSGVFYGTSSGNSPVYKNLPGGVNLYFSYSVSGGGTCYLRFYSGSGVNGSSMWTSPLSADDTAHESYIKLPSSGTYTVQVYVPNSSSGTEHIYAFTLYTK